MNISKIINTRRAVYPSQFKEGDIDKEIIKIILENANTAPTHRMTQPWFFKVYKNDSKNSLGIEMTEAFELYSNTESPQKKKKILQKCEQSNCIIAIFMKRDPKESIPEWEEIAATAMAVQNMWLTCVEYEIGCYWSTPKYIDKMNDFFMLKENERCLGFFYMGKYDHSELESKERESINVKTEWNF
jgi:nitroreductase